MCLVDSYLSIFNSGPLMKIEVPDEYRKYHREICVSLYVAVCKTCFLTIDLQTQNSERFTIYGKVIRF